MKILCIHGVGHQSENKDWQAAWKQAIQAAITQAGGKPPVDSEIDFPEYDDLFAATSLTAADWAKAAFLLAQSGADHVAEGWRQTRGWFDRLGDRARWTAGMVVQWTVDDGLRKRLRQSLGATIDRFQPDVLLAHSLGSLIAYDLLLDRYRPSRPFAGMFLSIGSQIGNSAVRNTFGGRLVMPGVKRWFHLYNPLDRVLTEPIKLFENADDFAQLITEFDLPNDFLNHDAVQYIANPRAQKAWAAVSGTDTTTRKLIGPSPQNLRERRPQKALIVGIDKYADSQNNLEGCVNDAYLVSTALQESYFDAENIRLVLNERATAAAIRDHLEWLLGDVRPGDVRYFHYSGHGAQLPSYGDDEVVDHLDECLVPYDFDFTPERAVVDKWFYKLYSQLPYEARFIATLDCCHSGGMTRVGGARVRGLNLPDDIRHRGLKWDAKQNRWVPRDLEPESAWLAGRPQWAGTSGAVQRLGRAVMLRTLESQHFDRVQTDLGHRGPYLPLLLEACQEQELAEEYRDGNTAYGAFTYALMTKLRESRERHEALSFAELVNRAQGLMADLGVRQHPNTVGPADVLGLTIPFRHTAAPAVTNPIPAASISRTLPVQRAIDIHGDALRKIPGVINVRAGYRFAGGWITKERALVVTVRRKVPKDQVPPKELIPGTVTVTDDDGRNIKVPVDVAPASPVEQLLGDRRLFDELDDPSTRFERSFLGLPLSVATRAASEPYVPPANLRKKLDITVTAKMKMTCHTSPGMSFSLLKKFLEETKKRLILGMFDLTAPHVVQALIDSLEPKPRTFTLVLDPKVALSNGGGGDNPKAGDLEETAVRDDLDAALGSRFKFAWAAVKLRGKTNGGLFPSAYHIKVAVRDGTAFWLSSGNMQSTNQPKDDLPLKPLAKDLKRFNREWHVIVENKSLAEVFEKYLNFDYDEAERFQAESADRAFMPEFDLLVPRDVKPARLLKTFRPKEFNKRLAVRVLLTPDNYADEVLNFIESANTSVYFQNQYIHLGAEEKRPLAFNKLCQAMKKQIKRGLDVRIILRDLGDTRKMLEELEDFGISSDHIRLQTACHNKGIIVDSERIVLGSHNWSGDGTTANRDASLLIEDRDVTSYYEQVFLYDWQQRAKQISSGERAMPIVVPRGTRSLEVAMANFAPGVSLQRIPWDDYFED